MLLTGVIPAIITPLEADGETVAVDVVPALVEHLLLTGINGFYVCGLTGEGSALTTQERKRMAAAVCEATKDRVPVCIHVGATDVSSACELASHAASVGASATASLVPKDQPGDLDAAVAYFSRIGACSSLPFYIYWFAPTAAKGKSAQEWLSAMAAVPNLAGFKFTDTNFYTFQQLLVHAPNILGRELNGLTGPDEMAVAGLAMGSHGAIGSTYNLCPQQNVAMHKAWHQGRERDACALQKELNAVIECLARHCRCSEGLTNIVQGIKAHLRSLGLAVGCAHIQSISFRMDESQEAELLRELHALPALSRGRI